MTVATLGLAVDSSQAARAVVDLDKLVGAADKAQKGAVRMRDEFGRFVKATDAASTATAQFERELTSAGTASGRAVAEVDRMVAAHRRAADAATLAAAANDNAAARMGRFRNLAQQAGYQVADFGSQIASGGNAMTALVQQGGQFLGMFGPAGAIAGAVLTVGGLAAQFLFLSDSTKKAKEETQSYQETMRLAKDLTGEAAAAAFRLANAQREQARTTAQSAVTAAEAAITSARTEIEKLNALRAMGRFDAVGPNDVSDTYTQAGYNIEQLNKGMTALQANLDRAKVQLGQVTQGVGDFAPPTIRAARAVQEKKRATDELNDSVERYIADLRIQNDLLGMDAAARAQAEAVMRAQSLAMREGNLLTVDQIDNIRGLVGEHLRLTDAIRERQTADQEASRAAAQSAAQAAADRVQSEAAAIREQKQLIGGLVSDVKYGLRSGEDAWKAFGDAGTRAIERISDRIMDDLLNSIFEVDKASKGIGGGSGGFLSGIFSAVADLWHGNTGGVGNDVLSFGGPRANGGPVEPGRWYRVGERGEEAFAPSVPGRIIPNHQLRASGGHRVIPSRRLAGPASGGGQSSLQQIALTVELSGDLRATVREEAENVSVRVVRRESPKIVRESVQATYAANSEQRFR